MRAGRAAAGLGDIDRAVALLDDATRAFALAGLDSDIAFTTLERGRLHLAQGKHAAALDDAERSSAYFTQRHLMVHHIQASQVGAHASLGLNRMAAARRLARGALELANEIGALWLAPESYRVLGNAAQKRGKPRAALAEYDRAISLVERQQRGLATDLRTNYLADKLQIYRDAIDCSLGLDQPEVAFGYLERAKSRALVDYLADNVEVRGSSHDPFNQRLLDKLARLREEHNWFYNRLSGVQLNGGRDAEPSDAEVQHLQQAIREREKQIQRLMEWLALRAADDEGTLGWRDASVKPTVPPVGEDQVLLEYYLTEDRALVFVVTADGLTVQPLAATTLAIQRLLRNLKLCQDAVAESLSGGLDWLGGLERNSRGILRAFYKALLEPVQAFLNGRSRLVVIPHGVLHAVPFHALYDGTVFQVERLEVSVCPSSTLLSLCSRRRPHSSSALILANSDGGRLPHVLGEARCVQRVLSGDCYLEEAAARGRVIASAHEYGVVHFATHGESRLDNPTFAHLKLADGQLSTVDVFNLRLNGALVTLSACESGLGLVAAGDEVVGLSRAFLFAGAAAMVQSLWRVEDSRTAMLMEDFYRAISAGQTAGAALRQAQLAQLDSEASHPFFWAPFELVGNGCWSNLK